MLYEDFWGASGTEYSIFMYELCVHIISVKGSRVTQSIKTIVRGHRAGIQMQLKMNLAKVD